MEKITMNARLWTAEEVAQYLGRTKASIYTMVNRGQIPYIKFGNSQGKNGSLRFDSEKIKSYLETLSHDVLPPVRREA